MSFCQARSLDQAWKRVSDRAHGLGNGFCKGGGARRDRTDDLMLAKHALYQLSYGPLRSPQREWSFDPRLLSEGKW